MPSDEAALPCYDLQPRGYPMRSLSIVVQQLRREPERAKGSPTR